MMRGTVTLNPKLWPPAVNCTELDRTVCIINDGQIPHMKGCLCGLDERPCVFSLSPIPFISNLDLYFLLQFLFYIPHSFSLLLFCNQFGLKGMPQFLSAFLQAVLALLENIMAFDTRQQPFVFTPSAVLTILNPARFPQFPPCSAFYNLPLRIVKLLHMNAI